MKLLFDLSATQPVGSSKYHGGGEYAKTVFHSLDFSNNTISVIYDSKRYLDEALYSLCLKHNVEMIDISKRSLGSIIENGCYSVFYSPLPYCYGTTKFGNVRFIGTVHGLRPLEMYSDEFESFYQKGIIHKVKILLKRGLLKYLVKKRNYRNFQSLFQNKNLEIITVSNHSKYSILSSFSFVNPTSVKVFYSPSTIDGKYDTIKPYSDEKYYLMISGNRWLKNSYRAVLAFDELFSERPDFQGKVIITGVSKNTGYINRIKNIDRFILLSYVSESELIALYKGAFAFIYPSLNEGFGYPPIDAMRFGIPVIASPFASITEICGDAVLYCNPYSVAEIKNRILSLEETIIREGLVKKTTERFEYISNRQKTDLESLSQYITQ